MTEYVNITSNVKFLPARIGNVPVTMSSREIAELVESSHDNVLKTIRSLVARGVVSGNETPYVHPQNGQTYPEFKLDYRNTMVVASGYSAELRAKIVDKWIALEEGARQAVPASRNVRELATVFGACKQIARLAGIKGNQQVLSAAQATRKLTGSNPLELIDAAHIVAEVQEQYLGPRQIGEREVPQVTAQRVNKALAAAGLQIEHRKRGKHAYWELTDAGKRAGGEYLDTGKKHGDGTPVRQIKWPASVVDRIRQYLAAA